MKKNKEKKSFITLYLQFIMTIVVIVFSILFFVDRKYLGFLELSLGVILVIMGYNNKFFYKRKNTTLLYVVIGIILIGLSILQFLGVY